MTGLTISKISGGDKWCAQYTLADGRNWTYFGSDALTATAMVLDQVMALIQNPRSLAQSAQLTADQLDELGEACHSRAAAKRKAKSGA